MALVQLEIQVVFGHVGERGVSVNRRLVQGAWKGRGRKLGDERNSRQEKSKSSQT